MQPLHAQATLRCLGSLLAHSTAKNTLAPHILNSFQHRSQYTRESSLKLFMAGLLQGSLAVDPSAAVKALVVPLRDSNPKVGHPRCRLLPCEYVVISFLKAAASNCCVLCACPSLVIGRVVSCS
jgi:hypothetical protein